MAGLLCSGLFALCQDQSGQSAINTNISVSRSVFAVNYLTNFSYQDIATDATGQSKSDRYVCSEVNPAQRCAVANTCDLTRLEPLSAAPTGLFQS